MRQWLIVWNIDLLCWVCNRRPNWINASSATDLLSFCLFSRSGPWQVMLKQADCFLCMCCRECSSFHFRTGQRISCLSKFSLHFPALMHVWKKVRKNINFVRACWVCHSTSCLQAKEELLRVIGLQEEEGSSLEFLRRGYKVQSSCQSIFDRTNTLHCIMPVNIWQDEYTPLQFGTLTFKVPCCITSFLQSISFTRVSVVQNATWWEENVDQETSPAWRTWVAAPAGWMFVDLNGNKWRHKMSAYDLV
jgi:hypothetical protein